MLSKSENLLDSFNFGCFALIEEYIDDDGMKSPGIFLYRLLAASGHITLKNLNLFYINQMENFKLSRLQPQSLLRDRTIQHHQLTAISKIVRPKKNILSGFLILFSNFCLEVLYMCLWLEGVD